MLITNWNKKLLTFVMVLVGLITLFSLEGSAAATLAQNNSAFVRQRRAMEANETGLSNPVGLAFSSRAKAFHVMEGRGQGQPPPAEADIIKLTPFVDRVGSARIAAVIKNPINMAFDNKANRLLNFQSAPDILIEVLEGSDGNLDPTTLIRHDVRHFGLQKPQGMTVDPASGHLFILDSAVTRIVRIEPEPNGSFENAVISIVNLQPTGLVDVRGLAFDPTTGNLHVVNPAEQKLYELTQTGKIVTTRDLSEFELGDPQGMVFAPSGDQTDDPLQMSLYLTDSGLVARPGRVDINAAAQAPGEVVELSFIEPPAAAASTFQSSLIQTINAWQWSPPSPDSAGIVYLPASDRLLVSDSEVNEMPIFTGDNLFETTLTGNLMNTSTTVSFSNEPTGVTYHSINGHLFFSDDDADEIFEVDPGSDGFYGTLDDIVTSFDTRDFDSRDPEGITFASGLGALFITDGVNEEVYQITPGANGIFDGMPPAGDDQVTSFDTTGLGALDPEGISFNSNNGNLYIVGKPADTLFEVTTGGALVQTIDISAANAVKPAGLAYAPSSLNPNIMSIFIAARGVDNNSDPDENDGRLYEMTLPTSANDPPVANDDSAGTTEDTPVIIDIAANDTDPNGNLDPTSANTNCATCAIPVNGILVNNFDGTFEYTPDPGFTGDDSFVYEICDTEPLCDTASVTIAVSGQQIIFVSSTSNGNVSGISFKDEDILAYDSSTATWSMYFDGTDVGLGASGQEIDALHIDADGSILLSLKIADTLPGVGSVDNFDILRFIPTSIGNNTAGSYELYFDGEDVELTTSGEDIDAIGFAPDGRLIISTRGSFSVGGISGKDDDLLIFTATSLGEITSGSWELYFDGSDVGLSVSSEDINGSWLDVNGDIYLTTRGAFTVVGAAGDGADIVTCVPGSTGDNTSCTFGLFWDGSANGFAGEVINGLFLSGGQSNNRPVANDDSAGTTVDTPVIIDVAANDTDPNGNLDPTSANTNCATCAIPAYGSLVNNGDGTFTYTPDPGFTGEDSFVYEICDTELLCDTATANITVTSANAPPVANDDSASTTVNTSVTIDVAANDSDPDGNLDPTSANTTCATCADSVNGMLVNNGDGTFDYTPNATFTGDDSFVYEICDTELLCDTATANITVTFANAPPVANDDSANTPEDTPVTIDVAANDSDPDGNLDSTSANSICANGSTGCNGAINGSLTDNGDGTITYTPDPGFAGTDSFVYEICDTKLLCDTASVAMTVIPSGPMTLEVRVAASTDDAEEKATGGIRLTSSDLELVFDREGDQTVGMRFNGINIPSGATIANGYIQFQVDETNSVATSLSIQGEDVDHASTFTSTNWSISSRPRTTAVVPWSPNPWLTKGEAGPDQQSPDIAAVIQEIVDRPGWTSGNSLVIIITGSGERTAESYNGDSAGAPLLHVEFMAN